MDAQHWERAGARFSCSSDVLDPPPRSYSHYNLPCCAIHSGSTVVSCLRPGGQCDTVDVEESLCTPKLGQIGPLHRACGTAGGSGVSCINSSGGSGSALKLLHLATACLPPFKGSLAPFSSAPPPPLSLPHL